VYNVSLAESIAALDLFGGTYLWNLIDDIQTADWQNVPNSQTPGWTDVNDAQTPGWTPIIQ
jgi:hypothetical protein